MSGFDRYAHDEDAGAARCPRCKRPGYEYDKAVNAWRCWMCGYRDRP